MPKSDGDLAGRVFQLISEPWRIRALKVLAAMRGQTMTAFLEDAIDAACRQEKIFTTDVAQSAGSDQARTGAT